VLALSLIKWTEPTTLDLAAHFETRRLIAKCKFDGEWCGALPANQVSH
jgi:hypothetical protein